MDLAELFAFGSGWGDELLAGFWVTVKLALLSYGLGTLIGLLAAFGELSRWRWLSRVLQGYAVVMRSLPELLIIFLFYYGGTLALQALLSPLGLGRIDVSAFSAGVAALALIQGAYASEVFRSAIIAVPHGFVEAAQSLGLGTVQTNVKIVIPLALRYAFPGLMNLWMVLIKITPLVSAIGLEDFIRSASTAGQNTKEFFAFYFAVLVTYLAISGLTMLVQSRTTDRLFLHAGGGR